ncbi:hypothetical protein FBZ82_107166 [Azospirillum brasilense]|uniref:Uncharacterized protein n=1 Tax=Azospirillum brasilense TaxID=192 RepID=A0A560B3S2_AZOBR|nr:hypothetical protein [Azospirillum brasilense]TWA67192.1 hypothetical protein FBZ82_107166 [Azospirillum brasilense]
MTGTARSRPRPSLLEELERRHDDAPPRDALRTAVLCGEALCGAERCATLAHAAALRLHDRLAAEARRGAAHRRRSLPAGRTASDVWLARLAASLTHHRNAASALVRADG